MEKLKKCPFCGGEAEVVGGNPYHWVFCKNCDAESKQMSTIDGAIAAWNTRKPMERIVERLEEQRAEHEQREKDARKVGLTCHADLNGLKAYIYDDAIEIVKEELC